MKKLLSIMLAVMMVLSTVSFAAPAAFTGADAAIDVPVVDYEAPVETEAAELKAELPKLIPTFILGFSAKQTVENNNSINKVIKVFLNFISSPKKCVHNL